ncbi:MAG: hypothetical protein ACRDTN_20820, partial [Mycobacterium sp.]
RTLGAAAGGLLGAAFLPVAVAVADDYAIVPDPASTAAVFGVYGPEATPPAEAPSIQEYQLFDVEDTTTGQVVGTFHALAGIDPAIFGGTNDELLVTSDVSGSTGTAAGDVPPVGSVLDDFTLGTLGEGGYANIYSTLPSPSGDVISDTLVTPLGNLAIPSTFDAAEGPVADAAGFAFGDGYEIVAAPDSTEQLTAINGFPPVSMAVQGSQEFDVENAAGNVVGTFEADMTTTQDFTGIYTEVLLVTSDGSGTVGTAAGDVPPVGSVFNTSDLPDGTAANIYSALPSPAGAVISNTIATPLGDLAVPITYDAAAAGDLADSVPVPLVGGYDIVADPGSAEEFAGVNGIPPLHVSVQGYQLFDVDAANGTVAGTFDADTTIGSYVFGQSTQTLLVTDDVTGTPGTAAGDVPPVGSAFDLVNYGLGFENVYSDLAAPSGNVISDTFVTPLGDFTIPTTLDLAAAFATDSFAIPW